MTAKIDYPTIEHRPWPHGVMLDHMEKVHGTPRGNRSGLEDESLWAHALLHKLSITPDHPHTPRDFKAMLDHELTMHDVPGGMGWDWLHQVAFPECDAALPVALLDGVRQGFDTAVGIFPTRAEAQASPQYATLANPVIVATCASQVSDTRPRTFQVTVEQRQVLTYEVSSDKHGVEDETAAQEFILQADIETLGNVQVQEQTLGAEVVGVEDITASDHITA